MVKRITTNIHHDIDDFATLEIAWKALYRKNPFRTIFLSWEWNYLWWKLFQLKSDKNTDSLMLISAWDGNTLIGIMPLYALHTQLGTREVRFLGTHRQVERDLYSEYLGILEDPQHMPFVGECIFDQLIQFFPKKLPAMQLSRMNYPDNGLHKIHEYLGHGKTSSDRTWIASLEGGFDNYLISLSPTRRARFKRLLRSAENLKARLIFPESPQQKRRLLRWLMACHQKDWQKRGSRGAFHIERKMHFHETLIDLLHGSTTSVVAALSIRGRLLYGIYGFLHPDRYEFYQSGNRMREDTACKSPGILTHLLLMKELSKIGVSQYDFLSGEQRYKRELSSFSRQLHSLNTYENSAMGTVTFGIDLMKSLYLKSFRHKISSIAQVR